MREGKYLQMLTANGDSSRAHTRYNNVIDKAGKWRNAANKEGSNGAPVSTEFRRVAIDAVEIVHVRYGDIAASNDIVTAARNRLVDMSVVDRRRWGTNSVMRMEVMGPRKIVYPPRKARNFAADARIFHYIWLAGMIYLQKAVRLTGTNPQLPMKAAST
jgi:hypothetical protein